MSYDLYLRNDDGTTAQLKSDAPRGGTYCLGPNRDAEFNITYNYAPHFYRVFGEKGIRTIYGMKGKESVPALVQGIQQLGTDTDDDYWKPTEGNARAALMACLWMALDCPDATWEGD